MAALYSIDDRVVAPNGDRISYREALPPKGAETTRPIILLHGIGSAARSWQAQFEAFASHRRVIAWNAPGYAGSTPLGVDHPMADDYAGRLGFFLDALEIPECDLVGHSLGCLMAASYARFNPERVGRLVLASTARGHAHLSQEDREKRLVGRLSLLDRLGAQAMAESRGPNLVSEAASESVRRAVIETMAQVKLPGYGQAARMLSTGNLTADVAEICESIAIQVVVGSEDRITPPVENKVVAASRSGISYQEIDGAGHAVYLEKPAVFNSLVSSFVEGQYV